MPTTQLSIGPVHTLLTAVTGGYALPARAVYIYAQGGTIEISNDGTTWAALGTLEPVVAAFVRTTVAQSLVTLKAA